MDAPRLVPAPHESGIACADAGEQRDQRQRHAVLARLEHFHLRGKAGGLAHFAQRFGALFERGARLAPLGLEALALLGVELRDRAAGEGVDHRLDPVLAQERQQFAQGHREVELPVAALGIGAEGVDPDHPPARIEQRPARIAARNRRGVEDGVELARRPLARQVAARFDRRLRAEDVSYIKPLGQIDIHRIADRGDLAKVAADAPRQRQRGQAQRPLGDFEQRQIVPWRDRHHPRESTAGALGGDDADPQSIVLHRLGHDMRVGDDPRRRDRKAGAVADGHGLAPLLADDHHPHHASGSRIDIARIGRCGADQGKGGEQCEEQGEGAEKPGHGAGYSRFFRRRNIERKQAGCSALRAVAQCFT